MAANDMEIDEAPKFPKLPDADDDDDWKYVMRRSMQEVVPGLFLGPYAVATRNSLENLQRAGITHIVCVRSEIEAHVIRANHQEHFHYLVLQMDNSPMECIIPKLKMVSTFVDNCLNNGGKVLIHGNAGMTRSPTLAIGYIMAKFGVNFKKAHKYVQKKRFCINVPEYYRRQLQEYEPIYMAAHAAAEAANLSPDPQYRLTKRKIEEVDENEDEDEEDQQQATYRRKLDDDAGNEVDMDEDEDL